MNRKLYLIAVAVAVFTAPLMAQGNGAFPIAGVTLDSAGNLYGTTESGGAFGFGTVFKLSTSGVETVLYSFQGGTDGNEPEGGVILDSAGNLYGTTYQGGAYKMGTVFKVSVGGGETVLHSFPGGTDGANPNASLVFDSAGNLYGTTIGGGSASCIGGCGTVFKVSSTGEEAVLYAFTQTNDDGGHPNGALIFDSAGNIYGTTQAGGANADGTVFKLSSTNEETVLYSFKGGSDGLAPYDALVQDSAGNLYGTTRYGGGTTNYGTIFRLSTKGVETVFSFKTITAGVNTFAGLVRDSAGNLYGTTPYGGVNISGNVFKLSPGGKEILYSFKTQGDGNTPQGGVIRDSEGNLYGTTEQGGNGFGTVFKISAAGKETILYSF
jgi:uncharacterized repeat protein (TIGR03803 family)